jgi:hypothetical protein
MAPEQASGDLARVGPHSDQYSLGVVLFQLLSGDVPFHGNAAAVLAQLTDPVIEVPHFRDLGVKVSPALEAICRKAVAKNPRSRYATAGELADDLDRYLTGRPVHAGSRGILLGLVQLAAHWAWQQRARLVVAALVAVAFIATFVVCVQARRQVADARAEAHAHRCDFMAERGRRLCETQAPNKGVLYLARAFALAEQAGDLDRQQRVAGHLVEWMRKVRAPEGGPDWDEAGQRLLPYGERLHVGENPRVAVREDGRPVELARDKGEKGRLILQDARTGEALGKVMTVPGETVSLAPDGRVLVAVQSPKWTIHDALTGARLASVTESGMVVKLVRVTFGADGRSLLVTRVKLSESDEDSREEAWTRVCRLSRDRKQIEQSGPDIEVPRPWSPGGVSRDGQAVLTTQRNRIRLHDAASGNRLFETSLPWSAGDLRGAVVTSTQLATCDDDGVQLWTWASPSASGGPSRPRTAGDRLPCPLARAPRFSPDGRLLMARGRQGTFIWDTTTRRMLGLPLRGGYSRPRSRTPEGSANWSWALFGGDGKHVITGDGGDVRLWRVPVAVDNLAEAVMLWVQLRTGLELDEDDTPQSLDDRTRRDRRKRFEEMLGLQRTSL